MRSWTILALVAGLAAAGRSHAQETPLQAGTPGVPVPKKTHYVPPEYPPEAIERGLRGIVILELVIDPAGKVVAADVVRSVPPFDDSALKAARQWEYEVTKVDGKPVSVRLTVPITFALKLPEISRQSGIPELRQGATPRFPAGASTSDSASVAAEILLQTDGTVAEARVMKGDSPWSEALLQAVSTWRFAPEAGGGTVSFRVEADFVGGNPPRVALRLSGLRRQEAAAAAPEPPPAPPLESAPAAPAPAPVAPASVPAPAEGTARTPAAAPAPPPAPPAGEKAPVEKAPVEKPPVEKAPPVEEIVAASAQQATAVAPSGEPAVVGVSSVRDVTLSEGVPDLVKGRRPVPPPLARMSNTEGVVEVRFSVDAAGGTGLQGSVGPDVLRVAAEGVVGSWGFRRTTTRRLYLVAEFSYKADSASAKVRPQE